MASFLRYLGLSAPLFALVLAGFGIARLTPWPKRWTDALSRLVFLVPVPALLFQIMTRITETREVDAHLLVAFFGGCFLVFGLGILGGRGLGLDGVGQSVFAMGGIFSNNVMMGLPLARLTLGPEALPRVALVLLFNAATLWTLATVSVEFARHGALNWRGLSNTLVHVFKNPIVVAIAAGSVFGGLGWVLPRVVDQALSALGHSAGPLALLVLGLGIAQYPVRNELRTALAICGLKLVVQPLVVWLLALALGLPTLERQVVVLLASLPVGINVYLIAAEFKTLQGAVASSLVLSTLLAALTTPLFQALL
jgi:malonate transporter and related proteins